MFTFSDIALHLNSLKRDIKERYDLTWTDYLILIAIRKIEDEFGFATSAEVVQTIGQNRGWVYRRIEMLQQRELIEVMHRKNPWESRGLNLTGHANIKLVGIENSLKRRSKNIEWSAM